MHTLSVILCAYTEARWNDLTDAIRSLRAQTRQPDEIIVAVDYNQALAARARNELNGVVVVENTGERGLSGARNAGIAAANGSIIVFLDDDAAAAPDWLAQIEAAFVDPRIAGTGGAIEPAWRSGRPAWFPTEFDWVVGCTYRGMPEQPALVRNLIGCNMAFRREVFTQIGGFRIGRVGTLSIGQENDETEFCIRLAAQNPNAGLLYQPAARVHHIVPQGRTSFKYFTRRCFSEGMSKATLARQVGAQAGLSTERTYMLRTLPEGVLTGVADAVLRGDTNGLRRAGTIVAGLAITAAGFVTSKITRSPALRQLWKRNQPAASTTVSDPSLCSG